MFHAYQLIKIRLYIWIKTQILSKALIFSTSPEVAIALCRRSLANKPFDLAILKKQNLIH